MQNNKARTEMGKDETIKKRTGKQPLPVADTYTVIIMQFLSAHITPKVMESSDCKLIAEMM